MLRHRSLSEKHECHEFPGPTVVLKGAPEWKYGIPRGSKIRIATAEGDGFLIDDEATREYAFTGDPGKYVYSIRKHYRKTKRGIRYVGEFLIGMTQKQWEAMEYMIPKFSSVRQTTKGPRWKCNAAACGEETISKISALEHEASHRGLSFLEAVDAKIVELELDEGVSAIAMDKPTAQLSTREKLEIGSKAPRAVKRGGRPRKNQSGDWTNVPGIEEQE